MRCSRFSIAFLAPVLVLLLAGTAAAAPTDFDTTFSGDGKMIDSSLFSEQAIYSTAVQADGKIVTVGSDNGSQKWLIMRFNTDGTLDTTFDGPSGTGNGKVFLDPSTSFDSAVDVAIVPATQRIVVAGRVRNTTSGKTEFGAVRLDTDGDIDPGFNSGAVKSFEIDEDASGQDAYAEAVALDGGKIVVGGYAFDGVGNGQMDFAIARLENDGDLDPTIDGDGTALRSMTAAVYDYLTDIDVDASGNIYTFGTTSEPGFPTKRVLVAARFDSAGSIDPTFNSSGSSPGKSYATQVQGYAGRVTQRSTGEYVLVGSTVLAPNDCLVVQFDETGPIDTGFSLDGYQTVDFKSGNDTCTGVDEDTSGRVLISGTSRDENFSGDAVIARLTATGDLDMDFDPDGKVIHKLTSENDNYGEVGALPDGTILATGFQGSNGASADAAVIIKLLGGSGGFTAPTRPSPLALDNTFDSDGLVRSDLSSGRIDNVNGMTVAADGSAVVVGTSEFLYQPSTSTYIPEGAVAKYLPNGSPDPSFDGDGVAKLDLPGSETAMFYDAAVQSDGSILVVGKYSASGAGSELIIVKYTSTGALDTSFDTDGRLTHDFDGQPTEYGQVTPTSMHLLSDGSFLVSGSMQTAGDWSMFAAKFDSAGQFVDTYGTDGIAEVDFDGFSDDITTDSVALADDSIAIAGHATISGHRSVAIAKLDANGSPDATFSGDGEVLQDVGTGESEANGITAQADGKLLIAGTGFDGATTEDAFAARFATDGSLDADVGATLGFSGDGFAFVPFGTEDDSGEGIAVDPVDGNVTLGGSVNYGLDDDFAFARFDTNGNLLASFDGDGFGSTPVGTGFDDVRDLAIDSSRRIVAAGTVNDSGLSDFGLARLPAPAGAVPPPGGQPPVGEPALGAVSKISSPRNKRKYTARKFKKLKGTATPLSALQPVTKIEVAIRKIESGRCKWLSSTKAKFRVSKQKNRKCSSLRFLKASGTTSWSLKLKKTLPKGKYEVHVRSTTSSGVVESKPAKATFTLK